MLSWSRPSSARSSCPNTVTKRWITISTPHFSSLPQMRRYLNLTKFLVQKRFEIEITRVLFLSEDRTSEVGFGVLFISCILLQLLLTVAEPASLSSRIALTPLTQREINFCKTYINLTSLSFRAQIAIARSRFLKSRNFPSRNIEVS